VAGRGAHDARKARHDGDEVLLADMAGRVMGTQRLGPGADPAAAARYMLRKKAPRRSGLVYPDMGIA
jgi:hypothetical protein